MEDKDHYLLFLEEYSIPHYNDDATKIARTVKKHVKPNGKMRSEKYAAGYADSPSVLESGTRKRKSRFAIFHEVFGRTSKNVKEKMLKVKEGMIRGV